MSFPIEGWRTRENCRKIQRRTPPRVRVDLSRIKILVSFGIALLPGLTISFKGGFHVTVYVSFENLDYSVNFSYDRIF